MFSQRRRGSGGKSLDVSYVSSVIFSEFTVGQSTSLSETGVAIGDVLPERRIVILESSFNNNTSSRITAITVGGVSLSKHFENTGGAWGGSVWSGLVPTGTTATVDVTISAGMGNLGNYTLRLFSLSGLESAYGATVYQTNTANTLENKSITTTVDGCVLFSTNGGSLTLTGDWDFEEIDIAAHAARLGVTSFNYSTTTTLSRNKITAAFGKV